jgi:hypothetical protein
MSFLCRLSVFTFFHSCLFFCVARAQHVTNANVSRVRWCVRCVRWCVRNLLLELVDADESVGGGPHGVIDSDESVDLRPLARRLELVLLQPRLHPARKDHHLPGQSLVHGPSQPTESVARELRQRTMWLYKIALP